MVKFQVGEGEEFRGYDFFIVVVVGARHRIKLGFQGSIAGRKRMLNITGANFEGQIFRDLYVEFGISSQISQSVGEVVIGKIVFVFAGVDFAAKSVMIVVVLGKRVVGVMGFCGKTNASVEEILPS